jgi:hypothetical protein
VYNYIYYSLTDIMSIYLYVVYVLTATRNIHMSTALVACMAEASCGVSAESDMLATDIQSLDYMTCSLLNISVMSD